MKFDFKKRAAEIKRELPAVYLALKDKETPILAKICAGLAVAYALSPVDLIPDFIPVLGSLDDIIIVPLLTALTVRLIPKEVWESCLIKAEDLWRDGKPVKWYYALPAVLLWLIIAALILKAIL